MRWFEENMGPERAATMMNLIQPVPWQNIATKRDLAQLEARLEARLETLLEARLTASSQSLRADLQRTFGTWLFASQAAVVAIIGVLVALT
jgi:flagellar motility protein MotE (MotC chaperone)